MADSESLDYLQPGFDARTLTIPRLRSVLVAHNIQYPSTAKKAQLVELFNEQVVPQAKKILAQRARAKRTSQGIFDADATRYANPFEEHEDLPPPSARTRSRSPRKASMRLKSEEPDRPILPPPRSPTKRTLRASSRPLQTSDTDTGPEMESRPYPPRRTRKTNDPVPQLKTEESDGLFRRTSDVFTSDNPFQSGSSPNERPPSSRRKTTGHDDARPTSSYSTRRRTDGPAYSGEEDVDLGQRYQTPVPKLSRAQLPMAPPPEPSFEAGEEFTPEEQMELAKEEETAVIPSRRARPPSKPGKSNLGTAFSIVLMTLLSLYAGWYRQEKISVGYCGTGGYTSSIPSELPVPEWAQSVLGSEIQVPRSIAEALEPQCEECPPHAYCRGDFSVTCDEDYILKPHPLSFGGLVPLPPTCEPDGEKARRVQMVANKAVEELRERTAKFECGELLDDQGEKVESPAIEEQELKQTISQKRSKKMNNREFEELWGAAIGEIKSREEVKAEETEVRDPGAFPNTYLTSTSLARLPLGCAIKRSIRLGLVRNKLPLSIVISLIFSIFFGRRRYLSNRAVNAQIPGLVDLVLERLANQKQVDEDEDDTFLFLPNLRDDVLRKIHSLRQREQIWQRVRAVVEQNSNVRTSQREGRSGEVGRAWEWIGPTAGDGARRRKSGRVSMGPDAKSEVESPETAEKSYLHQKWEEKRPIY